MVQNPLLSTSSTGKNPKKPAFWPFWPMAAEKDFLSGGI
jgi:hypothetical protein